MDSDLIMALRNVAISANNYYHGGARKNCTGVEREVIRESIDIVVDHIHELEDA